MQKEYSPQWLIKQYSLSADLNQAGFTIDVPVLHALDTDLVIESEQGVKFHQLFEQCSDASPDRVALDYIDDQVTYRELDNLANQLARYLSARGVGLDDRIGLLLDRSVHSFATTLAISKLGATFVPFDASFPDDRIAYIAKDSDLKLVVTLDYLAEKCALTSCPKIKLDVISTEIEQCSNERLWADGIQSDGDDSLCYVIYTSGSTGLPKGVAVNHSSICNFLVVTREVYGFQHDDRVYQGLTVAFDFSFEEIWLPLIHGATLVPAPLGVSLLGEELGEFLDSRHITALCCVPTVLATLDAVIPRLRFLMVSGEACPPALVERWTRPGLRMLNTYGPTEATVSATWQVLSNGSEVTIGGPLPSYSVVILSPDKAEALSVGEVGEIGIAGPGVARGYLNLKDRTAQSFINDFIGINGNTVGKIYRTGDLGCIREDGMIDYLGRIDTQVKIRGYRIELEEIETVAMERDDIAQAVVSVIETSDTVKDLALFVNRRDANLAIDMAALTQHLQSRLPSYMCPAFIEELEKLPMLASGKADRKTLPQPSVQRIATHSVAELDYEPPATDAEVKLESIWCQVLDTDKASVGATLFELGGHSLLALSLVARVRDELGLSVTLSELFGGATIRSMADRFSTSQNAEVGHQASPIERLDRSGGMPISVLQELFLFLVKMYPDSGAYNVSFALEFHGQLDVEELQRAYDALARRHEPLRTRFVFETEGIFQYVDDCSSAVIELVDVQTSEDPLERAHAMGQEALNHAFDLQSGHPIRMSLYQCGPTHHVMYCAAHHAITDGWSSAIFSQELIALYRESLDNIPANLTDCELQFADQGHWEKNQLNRGAYEHQVEYWRKQFATIPDNLSLPTDYPRPIEISNEGDFVTIDIESETVEALHRMSKRFGVTIFSVFMAAYKIFLNRYSGQNDICVSTPISTRDRPELENVFGCLINTLILRSDVDSSLTLKEFLANVQHTWVEAYANKDLPIEMMIEAVQPNREKGVSAISQTMLISNVKIEQETVEQGGLTVDPVSVRPKTSEADLLLEVVDYGDHYKAIFEYRTDLFESGTIQQMAAHYVQLLRSMVAQPDARLSELAMQDQAQLAMTIQDTNNTQRPYPESSTVTELVSAQSTRTPDSIAVVDPDGHRYSYGELESYSNRFAAWLQSRSIGQGDRVGIYLERGFEMMGALLAVMKSGAAYVPLDPLFPPDRLAYMADDAELRAIITQASLRETVPAEVHLIVLETLDDLLQQMPEVAPEAPASSAPAYVIYTSGSTGQPKGVEIGHQALVNLLWSMKEEPGIEPNDRMLAVTTLSFDIAGLELYLPLLCGAQVVIASREESMNPEPLGKRLVEAEITVMQATPSTWKMLLSAGWGGSQRLKALSGGEPLTRDLADALVSRVASLWNLYGPTETTIWSTVSRIHPGADAISVGKPIANTEIYVLDESQNLVPKGVTGELYIGGDGLAMGYLGRLALTKERFPLNPLTGDGSRIYRTGDRARWLKDGTLEVRGRIDDQLKLRGYRVEPGEIRARLIQSESVADAVVTVHDYGSGDIALVAYIVSEKEHPIQLEALRELLRLNLPDYMVPTAWVQLDELPLTPNGKIDKKQLPAPSAQTAGEIEPLQGPRTESERQLFHVWQHVLGDRLVGVNSGFFELGGHSLLAVKLVTDMQSKLGMTISFVEIFQGVTIEELARRQLLGRAMGDHPSGLTPCRLLTEQGSRNPLFMVGSNPRYSVACAELDPDQPVYQLDAYPLMGRKGHRTIEEIALAFVTEIRKVKPTGPYSLGGGCEGALIAYEIALLLQKQGEQVSKLIVWHTPAPGPQLKGEFGGSTVRRFWWQLQSVLSAGSLTDIGWAGVKELMSHELTQYRIFSAMFRYRPQSKFNGDMKLILLEPMEDDDELFSDMKAGWQSRVTGALGFHQLRGNHDTWLLEYANEFGTYLNEELETDETTNERAESACS